MSDAKESTRGRRDPVVNAYLADVDRSLIQKNLKLSVEERFLQLMELMLPAPSSRVRRGPATSCGLGQALYLESDWLSGRLLDRR